MPSYHTIVSKRLKSKAETPRFQNTGRKLSGFTWQEGEIPEHREQTRGAKARRLGLGGRTEHSTMLTDRICAVVSRQEGSSLFLEVDSVERCTHNDSYKMVP